MTFYKCILQCEDDYKIESAWNTSKYWAKQQALQEAKGLKIISISYEKRFMTQNDLYKKVYIKKED